MPHPTIGLRLPTRGDRPDRPAGKPTAEWAAHAERLGYHALWVSEAWGQNAFLELASAAEHTTSIRLGTAVVNVYSRTPAVLAMAAATLQRRSDNRGILGVGPSHATIIETLHGLQYDRPVRRTHEAIELVNRLTAATDPVTYHGEVYSVDDHAGFGTPVPVYNAALGEANRRATGRVADGWLPYLFPVSALESGFETIASAARDVGRNPDDIRVVPQLLAAVTDNPDDALDAVRSYIAPYVGRLPNYRNNLAQWYPDATRAIADAWTTDRRAAARAVPDELARDLGIAGTPEQARTQLGRIIDHPLVDAPILYVPRNLPAADRDRTIAALAPTRL